jgi:hypothetical protein
MACAGGIDYLEPDKEQVDWDTSIVFPLGEMLGVRVTRLLRVCTLGEGDVVLGSKGEKKGDLVFDQTAFDLPSLGLVIVGIEDRGYLGKWKKCYVMLLRMVEVGLYQRVGVGTIDRSLVDYDSAVDGQVM